MSIRTMSVVWEHAKVSGSELVVLLALADYSDDEGNHIFPSMKTLAQKSRLSEDQARRTIQSLCEQEYVALVEAGGWRNGRNWANEYRLEMQKIQGGYSRPRGGGTRVDATTVPAPMQPQPSLYPSLETNMSFATAQATSPDGKGASPVQAKSFAVKKEPTEQQQFFEAVCKCVGWDSKTLTKEQCGQVAQTVGVLRKGKYNLDDLREFYVDWFRNDWRGKKNQFPTISQLRAEVGKVKRKKEIDSELSCDSPRLRMKDLTIALGE